MRGGQFSSFAIKSDGTVVKWGGDDGNDPPTGLSGVVDLQIGAQHAIALLSDGTVRSWGVSPLAGTGTTPPGLNGIAAIAAGQNHNLVISPRPQVVSISPSRKINPGDAITLSVQATGAHGTKSFTASLSQNGQTRRLVEDKSKSKDATRVFHFNAGRKQAEFLKEGPAKLIIEAKSNDLRGRTSRLEQDVQVVLRPPTVVPDGRQHYINQGGMELVTFTATGSYNESGVKVGPYTFRSFPLPGKGPEQRFAMFAYSWELPDDLQPLVYAKNLAGTEATGRFWFKLFPKKFRTRDVQIDDKLMEKLVTSVDPIIVNRPVSATNSSPPSIIAACGANSDTVIIALDPLVFSIRRTPF